MGRGSIGGGMEGGMWGLMSLIGKMGLGNIIGMMEEFLRDDGSTGRGTEKAEFSIRMAPSRKVFGKMIKELTRNKFQKKNKVLAKKMMKQSNLQMKRNKKFEIENILEKIKIGLEGQVI